MIVDNANLACGVPSKESLRLGLDCVAFTRSGTMTSDGKSLMHVPYPKGEDPASWPVVDGGADPASKAPREAVAVPVERIKAYLKAKPKVKARSNLHGLLKHTAADVNGKATLTGTDLQNPVTMTFETRDNFPKARRLFPTRALRGTSGTFDARVLARLLTEMADAMDERGIYGAPTVRLTLNTDATCPSLIVATPKSCAGLYGLVMPVTIRKGR